MHAHPTLPTCFPLWEKQPFRTAAAHVHNAAQISAASFDHAPGISSAVTSGDASPPRDPGGGSGLLGLKGPASGWLPTDSGTEATGFWAAAASPASAVDTMNAATAPGTPGNSDREDERRALPGGEYGCPRSVARSCGQDLIVVGAEVSDQMLQRGAKAAPCLSECSQCCQHLLAISAAKACFFAPMANNVPSNALPVQYINVMH